MLVENYNLSYNHTGEVKDNFPYNLQVNVASIFQRVLKY